MKNSVVEPDSPYRTPEHYLPPVKRRKKGFPLFGTKARKTRRKLPLWWPTLFVVIPPVLLATGLWIHSMSLIELGRDGAMPGALIATMLAIREAENKTLGAVFLWIVGGGVIFFSAAYGLRHLVWWLHSLRT